MPSLAKNKKAYHDYEVLETFEAGVVLNGDEVKSIKNSQVNLKGSFVDIDDKNEAFMNEVHVSHYKYSSRQNPNPTRKRKLLLHQKEIIKIAQAVHEAGITCIPLELYTKQGLIKAKIGLCRGKKLYDKREALKKKSQQRDIQRQIKKYQ